MKSSDIEMKERKALAGSTTGFTYHSRAITGLDLERSGRHAQHATVTGTKPTVAYPRMPEGNPWHSDNVPPEESLGYEINSQEPNGTFAEIAASLANPPGDVAKSADEIDIHSVSSGAQAPAFGCLPEVGALYPKNVIADPPSDNPTNAEVGGEAGRGDVGGGITGHGVEGPLSMTLAQRAASTSQLRRGRRL